MVSGSSEPRTRKVIDARSPIDFTTPALNQFVEKTSLRGSAGPLSLTCVAKTAPSKNGCPDASVGKKRKRKSAANGFIRLPRLCNRSARLGRLFGEHLINRRDLHVLRLDVQLVRADHL